jgi:hypothetical protein
MDAEERRTLSLGWREPQRRLTALAHWQQHDPEAALACLNRQLALALTAA